MKLSEKLILVERTQNKREVQLKGGRVCQREWRDMKRSECALSRGVSFWSCPGGCHPALGHPTKRPDLWIWPRVSLSSTFKPPRSPWGCPAAFSCSRKCSQYFSLKLKARTKKLLHGNMFVGTPTSQNVFLKTVWIQEKMVGLGLWKQNFV